VKLFLIFVSVFCCQFAAFGSSITVSYSGTIFASNVPGISVGDPFNGNFTYSIPEFGFVFPDTATYVLEQPNDGVQLFVSGYSFIAGPSFGLTMSMILDPSFLPGTHYFSVGRNVANYTGTFTTDYPDFEFNQINAQLIGNTSLFPNTALPDPFRTQDVLFGLIPDGSGATLASTAGVLLIDDSSGEREFYVFSGLIDSIETTATPEPGTLLLALGGAALLMVRRRGSQ
jgi:hypothetical protein